MKKNNEKAPAGAKGRGRPARAKTEKGVDPNVDRSELAKPFPMFENTRVVAVIEEGTKFFHCKMENGTTMHVPAELFD